MVFWSGHDVDETAGSKRLGIAFGVRTIDRAASGVHPGDPSHTEVRRLRVRRLRHRRLRYRRLCFTDSWLCSVLESRRLNFRYCV